MIHGEREGAPMSLFPFDPLNAYRGVNFLKGVQVSNKLLPNTQQLAYYSEVGSMYDAHLDFFASVEDPLVIPTWDVGIGRPELPYNYGVRLVVKTAELQVAQLGVSFPSFDSEADLDPYLLKRDAKIPKGIDTYSEEGKEHYRRQLQEALFKTDPALKVLHDSFTNERTPGPARSAFIYGLDGAYQTLRNAWTRENKLTSSF